MGQAAVSSLDFTLGDMEARECCRHGNDLGMFYNIKDYSDCRVRIKYSELQKESEGHL